MKTGLVVLLVMLGIQGADEFKIYIEEPVILANHFKESMAHRTIMPGMVKSDYSMKLMVKTLANNKSGCKKYKEDYHAEKDAGKDIGILLFDSDNCSLSTKIHYAQLAGASALFLKYIDNKIEETEVDKSSFEGVRIPVIIFKNDDAQYIYDVLNSSGNNNNLVMRLDYKSPIDMSEKKIKIFMSSETINNPMITFLKDLKEHKSQIREYQVQVNFSLGFCKSCKEKQFLKQEPNCLSGGRYCVINSDFKTNELVKETLRQICIRDSSGIDKLTDYLYQMKLETESLFFLEKFKEKEMETISHRVMSKLAIEPAANKRCVDSSFVKPDGEESPDPSLDDNRLLESEQKRFFEITRYNIFPLIIINGVYYEKSINIREFIKFGCSTNMFDCRGFKSFKKIFLIVLSIFSILFVSIIVLFCRKVMRRKMENELNIKVQEAINKYLHVEKS